MKQIDDGGYVYARPYSETKNSDGSTDHIFQQEGITYRQLLVAHALTGIMNRYYVENKNNPSGGDSIEYIVDGVHRMADSIIAHQTKERGGK